MNIKILGMGCPKCRRLEGKVIELVKENNINADIQKVVDIQEMIKYGAMMTPGLVVNEKLKSSGNIPKDEQILRWIQEEMK